MLHKLFGSTLHGLPSTVRSEFQRYRVRRRQLRRLRKLRQLRRSETRTGYSLKQFDENKCIFIHIPKCAGVSICQSLFGNLGAGHHSIATYRSVFSEEEFNSYFKFSFVRNPWDRLVSAYLFLRKGGFHEGDRKWANENLSEYADFDSFVRQWVTRDNIRTWVHFRPQYEFICATDETPQVDFIGYYERLEDDFSCICNRLGINAELQSLNSMHDDKKYYKSFYNEETIRIVADAYREDIQCFGYDFDNSSFISQPDATKQQD